MGFGAGGRLPIWHGVGGFMSNSPSSPNNPNPGAPVPPLVPPSKKARFRILLYTGPYYKAFYVPATSIGRSARLFLVIQKENFLKKFHFPYVKQGRESQPPFEFRFRILLYTGPYYKAFYVPATSIGRSAHLFLVIQKENLKKVSLSLCKTRKRKPTAI